MADKQPGQLADELEREADKLERHSHELREQTQEVRQDWERKRQDDAVPGAPPAPEETGGEEPEAEFPAKAESQEDED